MSRIICTPFLTCVFFSVAGIFTQIVLDSEQNQKCVLVDLSMNPFTMENRETLVGRELTDVSFSVGVPTVGLPSRGGGGCMGD